MFSWSGPTPWIGSSDASEDVVAPAEDACSLDRLDVLRLLDDADGAGSRRTSRQMEHWLFFREVAADVAVAHAPAHGVDRVNEARDLIGLRVQDVHGHALRGLRADAGQLSELVDEVGQGTVVHVSILPQSSSLR